jgi:hypothetical protein
MCEHDFDSYIKWYDAYNEPACIILVCRRCGIVKKPNIPAKVI